MLLGLYTSLINMPLMVIGAVFGSLFLIKVHAFSLTDAALISSMISFGTIFGSTLFGYIVTKTGYSKPWMHLGTFSSALILFLILFVEQGSFPLFILLFFSLGLFTSTQVLSYPLISKNSPPELKGTSMGVAALIIMGLPIVIQPLTGAILDYFTTTKIGFIAAFSLFFFLFFIAFVTTCFIHEEKQEKVLA
jgi:MFS family permease